MRKNDYAKLDKLVQEHINNPIEVEIVGLFDGIRLGVNFFNTIEKRAFITSDNECYKLIAHFRSPLAFIEKMAKKADKLKKDIIEAPHKQNLRESELDKIIEHSHQ